MNGYIALATVNLTKLYYIITHGKAAAFVNYTLVKAALKHLKRKPGKGICEKQHVNEL